MVSDTPRTDAAKKIVLGGVGGDWEVVHIAFSRQLERELNAANAKIKRLEEAGDAIVGYNIGCGCGEDGLCRACCEACEEWTRAKEAKP